MTGSSFIGIFFALIRHQYTVAEIFLYFCSSKDTTRRGTLLHATHDNRKKKKRR